MTRQRIKKELQTLSYVNRSFLAVEVAGGIVWAQMETAPHEEAILLTILLKHGQSKNLGEIRAQLEKNCFYQNFPPAGLEVVCYYWHRAGGDVGSAPGETAGS